MVFLQRFSDGRIIWKARIEECCNIKPEKEDEEEEEEELCYILYTGDYLGNIDFITGCETKVRIRELLDVCCGENGIGKWSVFSGFGDWCDGKGIYEKQVEYL